MPIYVFKCNTCEEMWEENLPYEVRNLPTEGHCSLSPHLGETVPCYGSVSRITQNIKPQCEYCGDAGCKGLCNN